MFQVQLDNVEAKKLYLEAVDKKVEEENLALVYWDSKELKRRTCMSWNTIQEHFFHDPDFPKARVGGKWYYPAKEVEQFLRNWLLKQLYKNN